VPIKVLDIELELGGAVIALDQASASRTVVIKLRIIQVVYAAG
jgi:hypothetical protein